MKNKVTLFLFLLFCSFSFFSFAQDSLLVKWETSIDHQTEKQIHLLLKGTLKEGWHVYRADSSEGLTGITIQSTDASVQPGIPEIKSDFQSLPDMVFEGKPKAVAKGTITINQVLNINGPLPAMVKLKIAYETGNKDQFIPEEQIISITLDASKQVTREVLVPSIDIKHPISNCGEDNQAVTNTKSKGLGALFFIGFLGGLVALLTPCVFPMIPLTVSFFTKKATSRKAGIRNAFMYGSFIFIIYILLSLPFHFLDGINPEILNNISTNVYLNVFFFAIFIFFAFSFFGFYEISLPASFSSGADRKAGSGNLAGIFFMALTLALVSFSCTGPILGSLLAGSLTSDGGAMQLTAGMAGFGLALALPFALFALFPGWLQSLPKSGGWLTTVKIVLGFAELALALKFLSNADLVKHWGLLKREVFIGLWIIIGTGLTLYLFGKLKFPHDSPPKKLVKGRILAGLITGLFTLYLIPGVTNTPWANLKLISGFPPPLYYSIYQKKSDCVLGLNCSKDFTEGMKMAKAAGKPVLLDFTGYACVNCRRMEENVWSDPEVYRLMKDEFIVISLYVDDKKNLPPAEQFTYTTKEGDAKQIETVGDLWSTFETENFANNAQPLYAILNNEKQLLSFPVGYTPDKKEYLQWLKCSLEAFKKK